MISVQHIECGLPEFPLEQGDVVAMAREILVGKIPFVESALALISNAGVRSRRTVRPVQVLFDNQSLKWRNDVYIEGCKNLSEELMDRFLQQSGLDPKAIDLIITTSCTGFMIPAVDAHLINRFGLRSDVVRMPLTELGCAAGAMAMSRAYDFLRAFPQSNVVIIALEFPSLTYQNKDFRVANLVSCALFGDGGALVHLNGQPGPCQLRARKTHFFPNTEHLMGFDLTDSGFEIVLDKAIPDLIQREMADILNEFLDQNDLARADLKHFIFHPGGRKIMDTLREVMALREEDIACSRKVLEEVGNLSSASIFWVLAEKLRERPKGPALLGAFGPGFNAELLLAELG
ncbi:MAG: hypothetical protein KDC71_13770 [Acidobacteria bacterium]|nr:hypothetical protein [Acidobacteriota bacterium]